MNLPNHVIEAIREQARRDHYPDDERWQSVLATARVAKRQKEAQERKGD